ncbi:lymphocyte function-associated antigen 3 isoform X2 [Artibeus jamaicensis]|uniref:lymphocyte function-associated antigen 3 isoform X2 n=1 Tax=Artibeus jamaicensis TaxID=9417 RepID=UPI00235B0187|nr:lymphocyte function-associated antigen 3 isoform X2 [Artibeus jamaicensis]
MWLCKEMSQSAYTAILTGSSQVFFYFCKSSSVFSVVGTVNGNVTLSPPNIQPAKEILWKKGKNKVIEWDSDGLTPYPLFRDRVALDPSGALHISNLTSSDEGEYEIEIHPSSKVMKFNLIVFDPLPFPTLECNPVNESIVVQCAVPENYSRHREQLTYSWHCPLPQCGESTTPVLHLKKNDDLQKQKGQLKCVVANPESNRTSSVDLSSCIPHDHSRSRYPLLIMPVIIVVWLFVMCYWKRNRRAGPTT